MNLRSLWFCAFLSSVALVPASGQQTGSFEDSLTFAGQLRALSCFVPTSYDPNVPARLVIGLHGAQDESANYRNALVGPLDFEAAMPNTILICPDGGDDFSRDFYTPAGDEAIIEEAIAYATTHYNIDTSEVLLQGFSLGGRSALRYGLTEPGKFKGLLLNTPAVQGVKEATTLFADGGLYNYAGASELPIYITYGVDDLHYVAPIDSAYHNMVREDGMVRLARFDGGHGIPPFTGMPGLPGFFDTPALEASDLVLLQLQHPARVCADDLPVSLLLQNVGRSDITSARVTIDWGTGSHTQRIPLSLASFEHAIVPLDAPSGLSDGTYTLTVSLDSLNQSATADTLGRYRISSAFRIETESTPIPFLEKFDEESSLDKWVNDPSGDYVLPWMYDPDFYGTTSINTIFFFENTGTRENLLSPKLNLRAGNEHWLSFDVAYNYSLYTADVLGIDTVFADTLEVSVSTDCGMTFQTLYKKGGTELITFEEPMRNPLNANQHFLNVTEDDYRKELIDLSDYADETEVIIRFSYISALGGFILLDNIAVGSEDLSIAETAPAAFTIHPNPARDQVFLNAGDAGIRAVQVTDLSGKTIYSKTYPQAESAVSILTSDWPPAVYLIRAETDRGVAIRKVSVMN